MNAPMNAAMNPDDGNAGDRNAVDRVVYLMRGLPSCGKSHMARRLAGSTGVVLETDQYFYTQVGTDPSKFDYSDELLPAARKWNFERFRAALERDITPVVVDRGNGRNEESRKYAQLAVDFGYRLALREPDSEWWQEIRVLLKYKQHTRPVLQEWAKKLAKLSRSTHRVPESTILRWMEGWKHDLTVDDILNFKE